MTYAFTSETQTFAAQAILESIRTARPANRRPLAVYSVGAQVINGGNRYVAIQAGTTNSGSGPTVATGTQFDGTVQWLALGADAVVDGAIGSNLYMTIGKQTEWANPTTPDAPDITGTGKEKAKEDITALIALKSDNVRMGFKNVPHTSGTVYSQYDPDIDQNAYPNSPYVIVDGTFVYKCLDNAGGIASTVAPSGTSNNVIETSDGYIWKYVGSVSGKDVIDFASPEFSPLPSILPTTDVVQGSISTFKGMVSAPDTIPELTPIKTRVIGAGQGASAAVRTSNAGGQLTITSMFASTAGSGYAQDTVAVAWAETAAGKDATLATVVTGGAVTALTIETAGTEYVDATVLIVGDGTGAKATATVAGGSITAISIDAPGSDYTWAHAVVIPGTAGAAAAAVMAPANGNGSNLSTELNSGTILLSCKLLASLGQYIPTQSSTVDGSFRQITLLSGVRGTTRNAEAYLGPAHPAYETNPNSLAKYQQGSGYVLFVNNIVAIQHTATQEETIKVSITLHNT